MTAHLSARTATLVATFALAVAACGGSAATTAPANGSSATAQPAATTDAAASAAVDPAVTEPAGVTTVGCELIPEAAIEKVTGSKVATAEQLTGTEGTQSLGGCLWTTEVSDALPVEGTVDLQAETRGQAAYDELVQFQGQALTEETSLGVPASFGPGDALFFVVGDTMYTLQVLAYNVDGHEAALTLAKDVIAKG